MTPFEEVIERIEKARLAYDPKAIIKIVAASKYVDELAIRALYAEGQRAYGENKIQDLKAKAALLGDLPIEWHYFGRIQTNKINTLLALDVSLIHSIDSFECAAEIQKRTDGKKVRALLQINSAKEETKAGVMPETAAEIYEKISKECPQIELKGVMSIGAHVDDRVVIQKSFETTKKIYDSIEGATVCSMGMSSDFELAVACGSNLLRLGSVLFK